jgi:hypothetical protein
LLIIIEITLIIPSIIIINEIIICPQRGIGVLGGEMGGEGDSWGVTDQKSGKERRWWVSCFSLFGHGKLVSFSESASIAQGSCSIVSR